MVRLSAVTELPDIDNHFAEDVVDGLTNRQKQLPSKYHYDAIGSHLFEAICELPWYTITRSECALLVKKQRDIIKRLSTPATLIELGPGNGKKIGILAEGLEADGCSTAVHLVDVSETALDSARQTLARYSFVTVRWHQALYVDGLRAAMREIDVDKPIMVVFFGSNIGNFSFEAARQFLIDIRMLLRPGDSFLLGADLVKPESKLVSAYDDPLGVTSAFNCNVLARINRELDADFNLNQFIHRVVWNEKNSRVESYVVSQCEQAVCISGAGCCVRFGEGEAIWTESSQKYQPEWLEAMGKAAGFKCQEQWIESSDAFALTLFDVE